MGIWLRACWWVLAVVGAGAAVGLLVWVTAADLERSSQVAGVVGTVAGIAALGVALRQLRTSTPPPPAPTPVPPPSVRAEGGSNAAGGSARNVHARDTAAPTTAPVAGPAGPGVHASGGSNAAGGDIEGSTAQHSR